MSNRYLSSANLLIRLVALNERQLNVNDDNDNGDNESFPVDDHVSSNNVCKGVGVVHTAEESTDPIQSELVTITKETSTERLTKKVTSSQTKMKKPSKKI